MPLTVCARAGSLRGRQAVTNFGPFRFQNGKRTATVLVGVSGPAGLVLEDVGPFEIGIHKK
jgi:hypothetical protein